MRLAVAIALLFWFIAVGTAGFKVNDWRATVVPTVVNVLIVSGVIYLYVSGAS